jgi:hypothetical protein
LATILWDIGYEKCSAEGVDVDSVEQLGFGQKTEVPGLTEFRSMNPSYSESGGLVLTPDFGQ